MLSGVKPPQNRPKMVQLKLLKEINRWWVWRLGEGRSALCSWWRSWMGLWHRMGRRCSRVSLQASFNATQPCNRPIIKLPAKCVWVPNSHSSKFKSILNALRWLMVQFRRLEAINSRIIAPARLRVVSSPLPSTFSMWMSSTPKMMNRN